MKIGVSSTGENLDAQVDPRFGRCEYFIIVDSETMSFTIVANESARASGGAGIQAAQTIANTGVNTVLTGNMGPNAFRTLSAANIKVFSGAQGTIREAIENYKNGALEELSSASVNSHFGRGGGRL
jgi:predicted Fe-Mo cluster-binding NifX family protein